MSDERDKPENQPPSSLRQQAEQRIKARLPDEGMQDPRTLLHELQVHQIELEMQNETLRTTQAMLQTALSRTSNLFDFAPIPYLTTDFQGKIDQANHAAARFFDEPRAILTQSNLQSFICDEYLLHFNVLMQKAIASGIGESTEIKLDIGGKMAWVVLNLFREPRLKACLIALEDVTEKKRLEEQVRERIRDLELADRHKTEFLATLAHELRNPMSPLLMIAELLKADVVDPERLSWALKMIHRQIKHLARLVDDLLDVSRISRGQINLKRQVVDLTVLLPEAVEMCQPLIDAAQHQLTVQLPAEPVEVMGDPVRLVQVVSNLLNNAVKFTEPGGQLTLTLDARYGHALITVKDNGLGIDPSLLSHVFEQFGQVDISAEKSKGGLGVGLYLAKALVLLHGGTIKVVSPGLGQGAEFTVQLPLNTATLNAPQATESKALKSSFSLKRILVVDDNRDAAYSLKLVLLDKGHEVCVAHEGYAALELAKVFRPHLVLLDIGMPGMDGYEVCRRIRAEVWGKDMRVVALSGWGDSDDKARTAHVGFDHHLTKPAHLADIEALIQNPSIN